MLKHPNQLTDDLFEKSSMSFGEHLEELRRALIKSALWLALGTGLGLFAANTVVSFIKSPLEDELNKFYVEQAKFKYRAINGVDPSTTLIEWMTSNSVMPERVFIDPKQVADALAQNSPTVDPKADAVKKPEPESKPAATDDQAKEKIADKAKDKKAPSQAENAEKAQAEAWSVLNEDSLTRLEPLIFLRPIPNRIQAYNVLEPFMIWMKAGLLVGTVIASPGMFYHIWQFLAAGLYPHERRYVYVYLPLSVGLFVAGVALAFFVIFRLVIGFLLTYNIGLDIDIAPRLNEYVSFALFLPLGFGIAFQLPIVMLGLNRFGIVSTELFWSKWRIAVLGIAFVSMVLTPADAYSMLGMFIPLTILYFFGIALCTYMPKGPGLGSQAFDPQ
ncbi:MAG: twin-arginine translocase subunit TatC [Pirellulales bacterium]